MKIKKISEIEGVVVREIQSKSDSRGTFLKFYPGSLNLGNLDSLAISTNPKKGTLRGMHFQTEPFSEEKIVTCIRGSVFDVIIDIRPDSKTFGEVGVLQLSSENALQLYLPKGIAHGYQTLQDDSVVHYLLSSPYSLQHSFSINPLELDSIPWPMATKLIADKDITGLSLKSAAKKYADSLNPGFS